MQQSFGNTYQYPSRNRYDFAAQKSSADSMSTNNLFKPFLTAVKNLFSFGFGSRSNTQAGAIQPLRNRPSHPQLPTSYVDIHHKVLNLRH
jgi:hypothetical protein